MTLHPASMAERAVESTQHSATTPEITTREAAFCEFTYLRDDEGGVDAFCVYRVFFCVGQKLGHHFVEPGVCVYGGVDFVVFSSIRLPGVLWRGTVVKITWERARLFRRRRMESDAFSDFFAGPFLTFSVDILHVNDK